MNDGKCTPFKRAREKREFIKRIKSQCMFPIDRWALIINFSSPFLFSLYPCFVSCCQHAQSTLVCTSMMMLFGHCRLSSRGYVESRVKFLSMKTFDYCLHGEYVMMWQHHERWKEIRVSSRRVNKLRTLSSCVVFASSVIFTHSSLWSTFSLLPPLALLFVVEKHSHHHSLHPHTTLFRKRRLNCWNFCQNIELIFWSLMSLGRFRCDENISRVDSSLWVSSNNRYLSQSSLSMILFQAMLF